MLSAKIGVQTNEFDQEDYVGNALEAFTEFVDSFHYKYDAVAKDPPKELNAAEKAAWIEQNKRKLFLGQFSSRNLQKAFE